MILLFVDFDGVLRRTTAPLYRLEADLVSCFERAVRQIPDARIVISSSWRDALSLTELRSLFSPDVARLIIDVLPADDPREEYPRHAAILRYLKTAGENGVAIDDDAYHFPEKCRILLLIDGTRGFDAEAAAKLANYFHS